MAPTNPHRSYAMIFFGLGLLFVAVVAVAVLVSRDVDGAVFWVGIGAAVVVGLFGLFGVGSELDKPARPGGSSRG